MSLLGLQSAIAYVIRSSDGQNIKSLDELTRTYEMTPQEAITLGHLINQQRLKAYGEELFLSRWTIIREALEFLGPFVDLRAMSDLWEREFEPKSAKIVYEELVLKFVEFLVFDPVGAKFISTKTPAFLPSLMKYVRTIFTFRHNILPQHKLAEHSLLTDRYFAIISLEYDVRAFFAELMELKSYVDLKIEPPPKRDVTLLFVASDEVTEFRSFEIDNDLKNFLLAQLKGEQLSNRPSCYNDLVELGLCKLNGVINGIKRACCHLDH